MNRFLLTSILLAFLVGSNVPITAGTAGDSNFYFQSFDSPQGSGTKRLAAQTSGFTDEFNSSTINREASFHIPSPRFSLKANPGHLRLIFPGTAFFDHWLGNDAAPALYVQAPENNWSMTTRAKLVKPSQGGFFHTGLMVRFSQFDLFYWGIYQTGLANELRLERTGLKNLLSVSLASAQNLDVELRIEKIGEDYSFSYRFPPSQEWIQVGVQPGPASPEFVGLIGKTWVSTNLIVDFDYLQVID
jgi:hypothetical protein